MDALSHWWRDEVVHGTKGPLLVAYVAFLLTFTITRTITRLIRAGKGPFHNVSSGGVHLHHSTPGVLLLIAGGFTAVGSDGRSPGRYVAAVLVGVGASLVLDEFAMIFRLQDVYWSQEGQLSVNVVMLAAACVGLAVAGVSPFGEPGSPESSRHARAILVLLMLAHLVFAVVAALKGKYAMALTGVFLAPLAWIAAVRLARPHSPWARRRYSTQRLQRATARATAFDRRVGPLRTRWDDFIGGAPSSAPVQPGGAPTGP
mgnify:CR=1 FL=1